MAEPPPVGAQTGVVGDIDADVRFEEEDVDAVELDPVDLGVGGEVEHGIEVDGGLGVRSFPDQSWPHGVVQFWELVAHGISFATRDTAVLFKRLLGL